MATSECDREPKGRHLSGGAQLAQTFVRLGLEKRAENPTPDGPRFLTVGVKGQDFMLVLWPGTPGQAQPVQGGIPASVTIETDDIRKTYEELKSRGMEFETDVLEFPWGYVAQFLDPDGNRLQIREGR